MAAVMNGVALHGGFIPYGGTFLTFSDYSRNAIRMAALMKQRVIHVFTHDSIGLGEDGPTHQSVEHAASLRLIPNLDVWRPGDTAETAGRLGLRRSSRRDGPSALLLSRQNLPYAQAEIEPRARRRLGEIAKGAYVLAEPAEVGLKKQAAGGDHRHRLRGAARAARAAAARRPEHGGIAVRVVSMPSTTVFDRQDRAYKAACCRRACRASRSRWASPTAGGSTAAPRWSASTRYGESAPAPVLFKHFGFTAENVVATVRAALARR